MQHMTTNVKVNESFDAALTKLVDAIQSAKNDYFAKNFKSLTAPTISVMHGQRYVRIVTSDNFNVAAGGRVSRSVWGFVDMINGDILKAAGWKAPAKHARGNIFNENPMAGCNEYGPNYLR